MREEWAVIQEFPNYAISNYGDVKNLTTGQILRPRSNHLGYQKVRLFGYNGVKDAYIHQLVAKAFFGPYREGLRIGHVNGDLSDNRLHNLFLKGGNRPDEGDVQAPEEVWGKRVLIVETGEVFRTARDAARYIGGDYSAIYGCLRGVRKRHLGYTFEYYD